MDGGEREGKRWDVTRVWERMERKEWGGVHVGGTGTKKRRNGMCFISGNGREGRERMGSILTRERTAGRKIKEWDEL